MSTPFYATLWCRVSVIKHGGKILQIFRSKSQKHHETSPQLEHVPKLEPRCFSAFGALGLKWSQATSCLDDTWGCSWGYSWHMQIASISWDPKQLWLSHLLMQLWVPKSLRGLPGPRSLKKSWWHIGTWARCCATPKSVDMSLDGDTFSYIYIYIYIHTYVCDCGKICLFRGSMFVGIGMLNIMEFSCHSIPCHGEAVCYPQRNCKENLQPIHTITIISPLN